MEYLKLLQKQALLSGEAFEEPDFFKKPLAESAFFRRNTLAVTLCTVLVVITVVLYGRRFPNSIAINMLLISSMIIFTGTWLRYVSQHRKMELLLSRSSPELISKETLRLAVVEAHAGPWATFVSGFFLLIAIILIMGHYEKRSWQMDLRAGNSSVTQQK